MLRAHRAAAATDHLRPVGCERASHTERVIRLSMMSSAQWGEWGGGTVIHARGLSRGYSPLVLGPPFLLDNGAMRERESRLAYEQRFSARQRIRPCDLISVARL